ncbi:MAG: hypothetical protein RLZZ449_208 [Actinomycetota bacterium]
MHCARTVDALRAHRLDRERFVGHLDAADRALHGTDGVVVEHHTFE